ncbi:hypothetical protein, partial [Streptococcus suis]|uniref:hypothetical protein n=1 Tax=Streptococcus suis TaxID=1307 RepID=UPI000462B155
MKQGKTLLYVAGVSLICAAALMIYQVSNYKEQSSHQKIILFKKQKLTYNRFMKLTIEQTKE